MEQLFTALAQMWDSGEWPKGFLVIVAMLGVILFVVFLLASS